MQDRMAQHPADRGHAPVRLGIQLPQFGPHADPEAIAEVAVAAEELGFDSVWVSDHVVLPVEGSARYPHSSKGLPNENLTPIFEAITTLAFVAGRTRRIRLGTSVLVAPVREPILCAKALASLDALSAGRLTVGLGAGWMESEFEVLGSPHFARRGAVLEEIVNLWTALWSGAGSFTGSAFDVPEVVFAPLPAQTPRPPIWIGGNSDAAIRRAARVGDGWHGARMPPAEFGAAVGRLSDAVAEHGREPAAVEPSLTCLLRFGDEDLDPARLRDLVGSPALVGEQLNAYAAAGAQTIVLGLDPRTSITDRLETIKLMADEVMPALEPSRA